MPVPARSSGVTRKGGEREARGQYNEVRTRDERDGSCREWRQAAA